uniref:Proteasome assembly chaperone 1 n=1 Tax=Salvator merianae TaxID=96440 RepID=A0A8D0DR61_SALMN
MATFFGEVVTAPCRAGLDEEEEVAAEREETPEDREIRRELEKKREIYINWTTTFNPSADKQIPCSRFILGVGQNAVAFLSTFVLNSGCWEIVGSAKLWNEWCRTSDTTSVLPTDYFCFFYQLTSDPTVLLCQCNCYVAEDQQFQWLEKVFGCLQKTDLQVLVLSSCSSTEYKTTESTLTLPSPFLKALKTSKFKDKIFCSPLEQPNIARDLPAAVLSYCQVFQIPAVFYQCYTDVIKLDLVTIEAFKAVLPSRILKGLVKVWHNCRDTSRSTEILRKLVTTNEIHNIYT